MKSNPTIRLLALLPFILLFDANALAQNLRSVLVNACAGSGSEGENEYFIFRNDSLPLVVSSTNIIVRYGSSSPASTTYSDSFLPAGNGHFVNALNTYLNGSCDFSFVNARPGDTIPAHAYFMVMYKAPTDTIRFNAWCGQGIGNIYVLFSQDASWSAAGNFVNAPSSSRYFRTTFRGSNRDYSYANGWSTNTDGNYVTWSDTGTAGAYLNHANCRPSNLAALPAILVNFKAEKLGNKLEILWTTASEHNNAGFVVEQSENGNHWHPLGQVPGNGNSFNLNHYHWVLDCPQRDTWFRLIQIDFDGAITVFPPILFRINDGDDRDLFIDSRSHTVCTFEQGEGQFYAISMLGERFPLPQMINEKMQCANLQSLKNGWYILVFQHHSSQIIRRFYVVASS